MSVKVALFAMTSVLAIIMMSSRVLADNIAADAQGSNAGTLTPGLSLGGTEKTTVICGASANGGLPKLCSADGPTGESITSTRVLTPAPPITLLGTAGHSANLDGLDFWTAGSVRLSISHQGDIGIGAQMPRFPLDVTEPGDVQIGLQSFDSGGRIWTLQSSGKVNPSLVGTFQIIDRTENKARLIIDADGVASVATLKITGGADIAEPFKTGAGFRAGSVVSIDSSGSGKLVLSNHRYDRRVAGIVSGASNIRPGLTLEQIDPVGRAGVQPVSLSGRVYALADTTNGPINPGDLLTTSAVAGHVMRATDLNRSRGAVIGKAMTSLVNGAGLVLVLVSLQ